MEVLDIRNKSDVLLDYVKYEYLDSFLFNNPFMSAQCVQSLCNSEHFLNCKKSVLLFRPDSEYPYSYIKFYNYKSRIVAGAEMLPVIYTGHYIIDVYHSDNIIPTNKYLTMLQNCNPDSYRLDKRWKSVWHAESGDNVFLTLDLVRREFT